MKTEHIPAYFPSNLQYLLDMKRPVPCKVVQHFSFLSDKSFQTVGQLSSNSPEDFAETTIVVMKRKKTLICLISCFTAKVILIFHMETVTVILQPLRSQYCINKACTCKHNFLCYYM